MSAAAPTPSQAVRSWERESWPLERTSFIRLSVACSVFSCESAISPPPALSWRPGRRGWRRSCGSARNMNPASIRVSRIFSGKPSEKAFSAGATRVSRPSPTSARNSTTSSGPAICTAARNMPVTAGDHGLHRLGQVDAAGQRQGREAAGEAGDDQLVAVGGEQQRQRGHLQQPGELCAVDHHLGVEGLGHLEPAEEVDQAAGGLDGGEDHQHQEAEDQPGDELQDHAGEEPGGVARRVAAGPRAGTPPGRARRPAWPSPGPGRPGTRRAVPRSGRPSSGPWPAARLPATSGRSGCPPHRPPSRAGILAKRSLVKATISEIIQCPQTTGPRPRRRPSARRTGWLPAAA